MISVGQRVKSNRQFNKYDYSQDIRPYIITSVNANIISDTENFNPESGGGQIEEEVVLKDIESIEAKTATILDLTVTNLNSYELSPAYINAFGVKSGNNVVFQGSLDVNDKFTWNSSLSTLYVDANMKVGRPFIHLNYPSGEYGIPQDEYNSDIGLLLQYFNQDYLGTKLAFIGMDGSTNRMRFMTGVSKGTTNEYIVLDNDTGTGHQTFGDFEINALYVSKIIEHDDGDGLTIESTTNDINIISAGDLNFYGTNVNYNISGGYTLVNENQDMNFTSISSNLNLTVTKGDTNIDTFNGNLDIQVEGDETHQIIIQNSAGDINIVTGSTNPDSIHMDTDGGVFMTTETLKVVTDSTQELVFDNNGLSSNVPKTDFQKWISFNDFNPIDGYWFTNRSLISDLPIHYWKKERNEEYSTIYVDVDLSSRSTNLKGFKLTKVYFGYKIENADIFDLNTIITKKTFDPTNVTPLSITQIGYHDINLESGIVVAEHYRGIEIGNPFYIENDNILNIELSISSAATSDFLFYGCNLEFERNDL
jgi:hypothetical protein